MQEQKLTWSEMTEKLREDHNRTGVVVFKNGPYWDKEYPLDERSYLVSGNDKYFDSKYCGKSIFSSNLTKTDIGVRLDWYMVGNGKDNWEVDYCYLVEE